MEFNFKIGWLTVACTRLETCTGMQILSRTYTVYVHWRTDKSNYSMETAKKKKIKENKNPTLSLIKNKFTKAHEILK